MEWIGFNIVMLLCTLTFVVIGIWALRRETPMHFWTGTTVKPEQVTDIKKYNKANAVMWFCYCIPLVLSMIAAPFSMNIAGIIAGVGIVVGLGLLIFAYEEIIKKKYFR